MTGKVLLLAVTACAGMGVAFYAAGAQQPPPDDDGRAGAKAQLDAARRGLDIVERSAPGSHHVYVWSRRVLTSELNLSETAGERIAARERHLKRTAKLEEHVKRMFADKAVGAVELLEAEYHRCEAQAELDAERRSKKR